MSTRTESCNKCRFFEPFENTDDTDPDDTGTCRRFPPQLSDAMLRALVLYQRTDNDEGITWEQMLGDASDRTNWLWPTVSSPACDDWCGEFQAKAKKDAARTGSIRYLDLAVLAAALAVATITLLWRMN